jgi:sugar phosphate isomerase/epimerase
VDNFSKSSDTHPKLGSGLVNFKEIFEIMEEYNYKLGVIIELASSGDLDHSIEFVNNLI